MDDDDVYFTGDGAMDTTEKDEDPTVCDICLIGEVFENNEILFCDKCDVAVHQLCYGVKTIPEGSWYCYPCTENIDPKTLKCELCPYNGGAYKYTDKPNKWAHSICANWIPEVYEVHTPGKPVFLNLKYVDPKRMKLRCAICAKSGACVQCAYGRCTVAAHSWCALRNTAAGYTKRIVKDGDGSSWDIFCKTHASAVSDPVKPKKNKSSSAGQSRYEEEEETFVATKKERSSDAIGEFENLRVADSGTKLLPLTMISIKNESEDEDEVDKEDQTSFPVVNLSEWPGISEGEGMDADHFWNYISSCYPEDHSSKWLAFMRDACKRPGNWNYENDPVINWTCDDKEDQTELTELVDEILSTFRNEKEAKSAILYVKRDELLSQVEKAINILARTKRDASGTTNRKHTDVNGEQNVVEDAESMEFKNSIGISVFDSVDNMLVQKSRAVSSSRHEVIESKDADGVATMQVVFDGEHKRYACRYALKYPVAEVPPPTSEDEKWHLIDLTLPDNDDLKHAIIKPSDHSSSEEDNEIDSSIKFVAMKLLDFKAIDDQQEVPLHDRIVISKFDDEELSHIISTDQKAYYMLMDAIYSHTEKIQQEEKFDSIVGSLVAMKPEWSKVELIYQKQQIWKRIGYCLEKGCKDQNPDFNKVELASAPASWTIGRDAPPPEEDEPEPHEDAVCMCCFDGGSDDHNKILYCDGCNATMHQLCYGIPEVPEGDYFCDRCLYIKRIVAHHFSNDEDELDHYDIKNSVTCALCPLHHGGLKRTKTGAWVHMCCALWAKNVTIDNLVDMPNIDLSQVACNPLVAPTRRATIDPSIPVCCFCNYQGGFLASCDSERCLGQGMACQTKFHPLCAWFQGAYIHAEITDQTFQGLDRQGKYPSGIQFTFLCDSHSETMRTRHATTGNNNAMVIRTREEQSGIRMKYRINEKDLTNVPGIKKKRNNKQKNKVTTVNRKTTTSSTVQQRLAMDKYDDKCAICVKPISSHNLFGSPYDGDSFAAELPDFLVPDFESELSGQTVASTVAPALAAAGSPRLNTTASIAPIDPTQQESLSEGRTTGVSSVDAPTSTSPSSQTLKCCKCLISVHKCCLSELEAIPNPLSAWQCPACKAIAASSGSSDPVTEIQCVLCPRRGGYFRKTTDLNEKSWAHVYCARNAPGNVVITERGDIDIRQLPKLSKKQNCGICNRKNGPCVQCSSLGCMNFSHALCMARSNIGFVSTRFGIQTTYCAEHVPFGIEYLPSTGYWVDTNEMIRLQTTLERARLITDLLVRRDKHKKKLCSLEDQLFSHKFNKLLTRCKGGKKSLELLAILASSGKGKEMETLESEYETDGDDEDGVDDESDDDEEDPTANMFIPFTQLYLDYQEVDPATASGTAESQCGESSSLEAAAAVGEEDNKDKNKTKKGSQGNKKKAKKLPEAVIKHHEGLDQDLRISGAWHMKGEIKAPKNLRIGFSGFEFMKRDTYVESGQRGYFKKMMEKIIHREEESRPGTQLFANTRQAISFGKELGNQLTRQMQLNDYDFQNVVINAGFDFTVVASRKSKRTEAQQQSARKSQVVPSTLPPPAIPEPTSPVQKRGRPSLKAGHEIPSSPVTEKKGKGAAASSTAATVSIEIPDDELPAKKKGRKSIGNAKQDEESVPVPEQVSANGQWLAIAEKTNQQLLTFANGSSAVKELMRLLPPAQASAASSKSNKRRQSMPSSAISSSETHLVDDGIANIPLSNSIVNSESSWNVQEWKQYDNSELYRLERMIQVILTNMTQYRIVDNYVNKAKDATPSKKKNKKSRKNEHGEELEGRSIEDDFDDAPLDAIPDYDKFVRRIVTLSTIRKTLNLHGYKSLGAFTFDFFTMLNNARAVTASNSQTWKDTKLFAKLFEEYKSQVMSNPTSIPIRSSIDWKLIVERCSDDAVEEDQQASEEAMRTIASSGTRSGGGQHKRKAEKIRVEKIDHKLFCGGCRGKFVAKPWPSPFEFPENSVSIKPSNAAVAVTTTNAGLSTPARRSSRLLYASPSAEVKEHRSPIDSMDSEWQWLCGNCMIGYGDEICGLEVRVWWHDDECYYDGIFNAYDHTSRCHRVLYEDNEWEFANFSQEVFMIRPKSKN